MSEIADLFAKRWGGRLTCSEVAATLCVSEKAVHVWIRKGRMKSVKVGVRRLVPLDEVKRFCVA